MTRRLGLVAVALCLGGALTACGNGAGEGRVATGAVGRPGGSGPVPPSGEVVLVPLDGGGSSGTGTRAPSGSSVPPSGVPPKPSSATHPSRPPSAEPSRSSGASSGASSSAPTRPHRPGAAPSTPTTPTPAPTPAPPQPAPGTTPPAGPAALTVGAPLRAPTDRRWCEKVTVEFHNSGGSPVRSGTVTFATHIIGALGVDWATIESAQPLPLPIAAGAVRRQTYTVCVDAWRVPLGMRIETQDVTASWA
ncbi:hypothetical protein BKD26_22495 [Streptomyces sp. CB03238]|nr:hypothetical protein BKD26_22495 [Streptomyces sp. CB03238]